MAFKDDLQKLSVQVKERMIHISNEEMTKQALIIPFIQTLGFDIFNPLDVKPEYVADFGKKKGEKVDYALFKDNSPIIFVEAKSVNENLNNHDAQLSRYFNSTTDIKLAILTNGIEYRFFTDLKTNNIMDEEPFLSVDITNLKDSDIESISRFRRDSYDKESLITYAEELVYTSNLNDTLRKLFNSPSDDFIRFLIKDFSETRVTSNVIDRFRPLVKNAISDAVIEIFSKGFRQESELQDEEAAMEELTMNVVNDENKKGIVTTKEELEAYNIIKRILEKNNRDVSELNYKDTTNYFAIYSKGITRCVARLNLDAGRKFIGTKLSVSEVKSICSECEVEQAPKIIGDSRIIIDSINDINNLEGIILKAYDILG